MLKDMIKHVFGSRRFLIAFFSVTCLTSLGLAKGHDVGLHIAAIVAAVSAANAMEPKNKPQE